MNQFGSTVRLCRIKFKQALYQGKSLHMILVAKTLRRPLWAPGAQKLNTIQDAEFISFF